MPASGKKGEGMSDAELEQRSEATLKHGAYSAKMTPEKVSRMMELQERLSARPGLVEVQKDLTAKAVEISNVIVDWVIRQHKAGKSLDDIPALTKLPAYFNTANRALGQLHSMLPDESQMLDEGVLLMELRREDAGEDEED